MDEPVMRVYMRDGMLSSIVFFFIFLIWYQTISVCTIVTSTVIGLSGDDLKSKLNAGLSEQQQEDLFQNERSMYTSL